MRIFRSVHTGKVKTRFAWVKFFESMRQNGDLSGSDEFNLRVRNGDLVMVNHRG